MLLADKIIGHVLPIRFILIGLIGALGLLVHLTVLWLCFNSMQLSFELKLCTVIRSRLRGNGTILQRLKLLNPA
jgi:hypothetical protein